MALEAFTFDAARSEAFLRLGYHAYRDDPDWVPPLEADLRAQLEPSFPFYAGPGNHHRRFLAWAGGRPVARVLASVNRHLRDRDGTPLGAVGFFESEDSAAGAEVLEAACAWLRDAHGISRVWGPLNFDIWYGYRLRTQNSKGKPFLGEPYNKPTYPDIFQGSGFAPRQRWHTFELDAPAIDRLRERDRGHFERLLAQGYRFESLERRPLEEAIVALHGVLTRSFAGFLGFTPIGFDAFERLLAVARQAVHRGCSTFVYDETGALVGFVWAFVDLAAAVRALGGHDSWLGRVRFWRQRRNTERLLLHLGGLTPEEAARHRGTARAAFHHLLSRVRGAGYDSVLATLVAEGNPVRRLYGESAKHPLAEYVLYERRL